MQLFAGIKPQQQQFAVDRASCCHLKTHTGLDRFWSVFPVFLAPAPVISVGLGK